MTTCCNVLNSPSTSLNCSNVYLWPIAKKDFRRRVSQSVSPRSQVCSGKKNAKGLTLNVSPRCTKNGHSLAGKFQSDQHGFNRNLCSHYYGSPLGEKILHARHKNLHKHDGILNVRAFFSNSRSSASCSSKKASALKTTKHLLAGFISVIISRTIVAPLERLKLEYILHGNTEGMYLTMYRIFTTEGLFGFWRGNILNLLRTAPYKSINFFAYDMYQKQWRAFSGSKEPSNLERVIAGAAAAITATVICFPLDTIRIRLIAPGGQPLGGLIECTRAMIEKEGISSLYTGLLPALVSMAPSGAIFYGIFGLLKSSCTACSDDSGEADSEDSTLAQKFETGPHRTLLYGAIAGVCAETFAYPFEVIRRQLQLRRIVGRIGLIEIFKLLVKRGGIRALYVGLLPSAFQVFPSAALSFFLYEVIKVIFGVE